jgi:MscS family membrane protein
VDRLLEFYRIEAHEAPFLFWVKETVVSILIFLGFWLLSRLLRYFLVTWGPKFTSFTKTDLDDRILQRVTPPSSLLVVTAGLYYAVKSLPLPEKGIAFLSGVIFIAAVIIFTNIAYRIADEFIKWYTVYSSDRNHASAVLGAQLIPLLEKVISIFLIATALIIVLKHFNYDILSLVTALGIGSLAIGMAAKDTLANMISGFTIMLDRPFRIGDRIQLAQGQLGDVVDIGLRSTKMKTPDNTVLIIPNADLCNSTVVNFAFPTSVSQGKVTLSVAYGTDIEAAKEILAKSAFEVEEVLREPAPVVFFTSFGESGLNLMMVFWVENYAVTVGVTDRINTLILRRFAEHGIEIPYPTRTVVVKDDRQTAVPALP